uniref:Uncharacterized protein n=1 Tax=Amphora coffeiformis TaxID=265554 RepID=A0A6S8IF84_9STRA|mmetsp:Transcript_11531/g.21947  ORF Transcript_11531/g.21947 Transcript_11531/m.21947 type:complete len:300 (+) Transcript_11531:212-1111(+)
MMNRLVLVAARQQLSPLVARTCLKAGGAAMGSTILRFKATMPEPQFTHRREESRLTHTKFGNVKDVPEGSLTWPTDFTMRVESNKGHVLEYKMVNVETEAERAAQIFQHASGEIQGNSKFDWHHSAPAIKAYVKNGQYSLWGTYENGQLMAVQSAELLPGQRGVRWVWGAEDPNARHHGIWESIGDFMNNMIAKTGAQYGSAAIPTTQNIAQRAVEEAGWMPDGFLRGALFYGDQNGKYYRQNLIHYSKLFNNAEQFVQDNEDMVLTNKAAKLVSQVTGKEVSFNPNLIYDDEEFQFRA